MIVTTTTIAVALLYADAHEETLVLGVIVIDRKVLCSTVITTASFRQLQPLHHICGINVETLDATAYVKVMQVVLRNEKVQDLSGALRRGSRCPKEDILLTITLLDALQC